MQKILVLLLVALYGVFCDTARACDMNEIDVLADGTNCQTAKFTITTTNLSANTEFKFYMSAMGTFYVDWGDGTVDTITRDNTDETLYDHTYTTAGVKTIRFGGLATGYVGNSTFAAIRFGNRSSSPDVNDATPKLLEKLSGSLGSIFPTIPTRVPPRFMGTFRYCSNLTEISENMFTDITRTVYDMFNGTFMGCSSLRAIPDKLFNNIKSSDIWLFRSTFEQCVSLTSIPDHLFANISTAQTNTFQRTFYGCTGLTGYIPPTLFSGLIANGSPTATDMWAGTFSYTNLATTCPAGTVQFITGYEDYWDGHVSCVDENLVCGAGEYLPQHWYQCEKCPNNNYCSGGIYTYNGNSQGATACPSGLYSPVGMWESAQCGRILHIGDEVVYLRSVKKTTPALHVDIDNDGVADFFGNVTTLDVPMHTGTDRKLKLQYNGVTYSVYDDTVNVGE